MDWLWDLFRGNPWLALILLGVVGQLFTPNPKKRKAQEQRTPPSDPQATRTDPDEVAERIRELFAGKAKPEVLRQPAFVAVQEVEYQPIADLPVARGSLFDQSSIDQKLGSAGKGRIAHVIDVQKAIVGAHTLDPQAAIRALLILGPPRAIASYDQDPLLSQYLKNA